MAAREPWLEDLADYLLTHGAGGPDDVAEIVDRYEDDEDNKSGSGGSGSRLY